MAKHAIHTKQKRWQDDQDRAIAKAVNGHNLVARIFFSFEEQEWK